MGLAASALYGDGEPGDKSERKFVRPSVAFNVSGAPSRRSYPDATQRSQCIDAPEHAPVGVDQPRWPRAGGAHEPTAGLDGPETREGKLLLGARPEIPVAGE